MRGHTRAQPCHIKHMINTPPASYLCTTKNDTLAQTKYYNEKSQTEYRLSINLFYFIESHFERLNIVNYKFIERKVARYMAFYAS